MALDRHFHPKHRFGEALRGVRAEKIGDRTMRGEEKPVTDESGAEPEGKEGIKQRHGKGEGPKIHGKVRRIEAEAVHGGHKVRVTYHQKKGKRGEPMAYVEPHEHFHGSKGAAKAHMLRAFDAMEPEPEPDSSEIAKSL